MMKCKEALQATDGDEQAAIEWLRKDNVKVQESRMGRETAFGRMGLYADWDAKVGALVELLCESAPVAANSEFVALAADMAQQLAKGKGAKTADELLDQPAPSSPGQTLREAMLDASNRIREVFRMGRVARIDGQCAGYAHHAGRTVGVLVEVEGGTPEAAKDVCLHIASMAPQVLAKEDVPAAEVEKEREILSAAARNEGKPESIIAKMVEGRLRNFYAERALVESRSSRTSPFPSGSSPRKTTGKSKASSTGNWANKGARTWAAGAVAGGTHHHGSGKSAGA
jgi:elongation factor Ts